MKRPFALPNLYAVLAIMLCLLALLCSGIQAYALQQQAELTGTTEIIGDETGISVAISGDTAVVGMMNQLSQTGVARVFVKPTTGWMNMHETATLTPSDGIGGDHFGEAVAIDGDTILVAAQNVSAVYVFVKPAGGWKDMTQTAKLTTSVPTSRFGLGLSISGDTVVIGAYGTQPDGAAYVYVRPQSGWTDMQETAELLATNKGDFGIAVAVSGNTIVVGASTAVSQTGVVYVYTRPVGGWKDVQPTAALTGSDSFALGNFGGSVAISGNAIVVGAYLGGNLRTGEAYVFVKPTNGWTDATETAKLGAPKGASQFGISVSINGSSIIVGAAGSFQDGNTYVFIRPKSGWMTTSKFNAQLKPSDATGGDLFGVSVAIDGTTELVGALGHDLYRGAAYVFGR